MEDTAPSRFLIPAVIVSIVLLILVFGAFQSAKSRTGDIVLPGGITYVGPTPSPTEALTKGGTLPIPADVKWTEYQGKTHPYSFMYPQTLSLGVFPNDPYDSVTIFYENTDANANIFFRVEDLNKLNKSQFVGKLQEYVRNWWKDYNWKGVASVTDVTNSNGLKGYRATYTNEKGEAPYEHVFFEVPGKPNLVIWISGRLFAQEVFNTLVESVAWQH
jgi:hypothetical protein